MKLLPCDRCDYARVRAPKTGKSVVATLPKGKREDRDRSEENFRPMIVGQEPLENIAGKRYLYLCLSCMRTSELHPGEWVRLPDLTLDELRQLGEEWRIVDDLRGAGVSEEQLADLEGANVDWASLHPTPAQRGIQ